MSFIKALFSTTGLLIALYILVGVFVNTGAPHLPTTPGNLGNLHSWVQYAISVMFWPLSFWKPNFTVGKWNP
jgi:hypothetical protein